MSQITSSATAASIGAVLTLEGNSGGKVGPTAGNINVVGSGSVSVAGNPGTSTLTITNSGAVAIEFDTDSSNATPSSGIINFKNAAANQGSSRFKASGNTVDLIFTDANGNTALGLASFGTPGSSTGNTALGYGALEGAAGNNNTAIGINSLGSGGGAENVALGGAGELLTSGNWNVFVGENSGANYTSSESSNICLGYNTSGSVGTSNTLVIGNGTGTSSGQLAATYISGISGVNVGSVATVVTEASNQLGTAVLTPGTGISIVASANTITINATGGGDSWSVITANQTAAVNHGYFCNKSGTLALALPSTSAVGDAIEVANINTTTGTQFTQAAGQQIFFAGSSTTSGATGTLTSSAVGDTLKMVCRTANTVWQVTSSIGNWTPA